MPQDLTFPPGFRWGTATAAYQVEGDNVNSHWWPWEQEPGHIWQNQRSGAACEWWAGRAEEDLERAAGMGQNAHRLSLEWSRLEPRPGEFSQEAFARYRQILTAMREMGIEPMVTLYHFSSPIWLAARDDWEENEVIRYFRRFTERVVQELGDLVDLWCTINEPQVYASLSYLLGTRPPQKKNFPLFLRVVANMLKAHGAAYRVIHRLQQNARVGIAPQIRLFEPWRPASQADVIVAHLQSYLFNEIPLLALKDGLMRFPFGSGGPLAVVPQLIDAVDWVGVNYYTREMVTFDISKPLELFGRRFTRPRSEVCDFIPNATYATGAEIYPQGLYDAIQLVRKILPHKPIYIAENGLPDASDSRRPRSIVNHLTVLHRAIQDGADVRGYYHWTLVDNFEWDAGWSLRFGLIELDPLTQVRRPRPSAELYTRIARANAVPGELL